MWYQRRATTNGAETPRTARWRSLPSARLSGRQLLIAGLWEQAKGPDGLERRFLVLTRAMNRYKAIHDRTPVLLTPAAAEAWMDPKAPDREVLEAARSCTDDDLIVRPVVSGPTRAVPEGPHLMESVGEAWPW